MAYKMMLNKEKFLKTEFGSGIKRVVEVWDQALEKPNRYTDPEVLRTLTCCQAQWEVYKLAMKQFYDIEYCFTRTDEYYGLCTEDESDWLMKVEREQIQFPQYHASAEDIKEAMRRTGEMQRIAREYKSNIPDQSETNVVGLVLGRAAELGKITL